MFLSKRKLTVWTIGLVVFFIFLAAIFLSGRGEGLPKSLTLTGYTNVAGEVRALFSFERSDHSRLFNLTRWERQIAQLVLKNSAGVIETNQAANVDFVWVGADSLLSVVIPTNISEFSLTYSRKQRLGRTKTTVGLGRYETLFVLPWATTELFQSANISVTNRFMP